MDKQLGDVGRSAFFQLHQTCKLALYLDPADLAVMICSELQCCVDCSVFVSGSNSECWLLPLKPFRAQGPHSYQSVSPMF